MDIVTCLLTAADAAAAVTATDAKRSSVLHYAISSGKPSTELLIERGADVNAEDSQGMTVLHQAAKSCPCAVVEMLLANGAVINIQVSRSSAHLSNDHNEYHVPARVRCVWSNLSLPGRLVLSDLIGAGDRQTCSEQLNRGGR